MSTTYKSKIEKFFKVVDSLLTTIVLPVDTLVFDSYSVEEVEPGVARITKKNLDSVVIINSEFLGNTENEQDGNWRLKIESDGNLYFQKRISGSWVNADMSSI